MRILSCLAKPVVLASLPILILTCIAEAQTASSPNVMTDFHIVTDHDNGRIAIVFETDLVDDLLLATASADCQLTHPDGTTEDHSGIPLRRLQNRTDKAVFTVELPVAPVISWHPKSPNLYQLDFTLRQFDGTPLGSMSQRFGMRTIENRNGQFFVNNEPFYVRACGHEHHERCDTITREQALKLLKQIRAYGFNTVRHHSHVPPQVYLDAADEIGVLVQMEIHGKIGTDTHSSQFKQSRKDWIDMVEAGRSHPCVFVYSMGNEIYKNDPGLVACQNALYDIAKQMDPIPLVLNRSGSNPYNDAVGKYDLIERPIGEYEHVAPYAREAFMLYLRGDRVGRSDAFPIIAHEYPLVASYPNPALIGKYAVPPAWLETTIRTARQNGLEHLLPTFVRNCEAIQAICRKEMLEEARKFRELDGYSMLRFTDWGAYVSGVTDDFADPKNVTATEFLQTNGETVLLCTPNGRNYAYHDPFEATIEISHHGPKTFTADRCRWWLMNGPNILDSGEFSDVRVGAVDVAPVGTIRTTIPTLHAPARLTLRADLPDTHPLIQNEWHVWAYPSQPSDSLGNVILWDPQKRIGIYRKYYPWMEYRTDPEWKPVDDKPDLVITDSWQPAFETYLGQGGRVWVISDKSWSWPEEVGIFGLHITRFNPAEQSPVVFPEWDEACSKWMTICSNAKSRYGNSGTVIAPHPVMDRFPHEGFCDLNCWHLLYRAKTLQLDRFPPDTEPIIRAIDNYYRNRSKGYMVELGVGEGKLMISTLNFTQHITRDIATRYLFDQVLQHVVSPEWKPRKRVPVNVIHRMISDFAVEHANRKPLLHDEMPARYATRWQWLLSPYEIISLQIYNAEGIDESRLAVHWQYAQSQWYYDATAGELIQWSFRNRSEGTFECTLHLAGPSAVSGIAVQIDDRDPQMIDFASSDGWNHFVETTVKVPDLKAGEHTLKLTIPGIATSDTRVLQLREVKFRATGKK